MASTAHVWTFDEVFTTGFARITAMRLRLRIDSFLWAMLLLAVCFGWLADRSWLQHKLNVITRIQDQYGENIRKMEKLWRGCGQVNKELGAENAKLRKANNYP